MDTGLLRPPNHRMRNVAVSVSVSDNGDASPLTRIISVSSNESLNGTGDGNTDFDWEVTGGLTVDLRAERAGGGNVRIYTVTVESTDASGNSSTATVDVTVPHDLGNGNGGGAKKGGKQGSRIFKRKKAGSRESGSRASHSEAKPPLRNPGGFLLCEAAPGHLPARLI